MTKLTPLALAVLALSSHAQTTEPQKLERIEVTGSLIKRTDKETPAVVQTISRQDIQRSGFATVEELLRANSAVDAGGSIQDGAASGFVNGLATISLRGFGAQGTLVLVNGRRIAPAAAVDVNFGRGTLLNVNTIPKGAIDRIEILKDGASALYGSDAMAGVINYVLRKDFNGIDASAGVSASDKGVGKTTNASLSYGLGNLSSQGFNLIAGLEASKRDPVWHSELKDRGELDEYNRYLGLLANGTTQRYTPDSMASRWANVYRLPPTLAGNTTLDGRSVPNNDLSGVNYLGTIAGCPSELTVGQGVPNRPLGFASTTPSLRTGACRFNLDDADQAISEQDRLSGSVRATLALGRDFTAYADLALGRTKSTEGGPTRTMTTTLASQAVPNVVATPRLDRTVARQAGIVLPVGHPDNPTNGTATPQPVQLIYRFHDLPAFDITEQKATRAVIGIEGYAAGWDIDSALLYSRMDSTRTQTNRLRSSLLNASIASGTYRFNGQVNTPAAIASVSSDAVNEGESSILSLDLRAGRELFAMGGGQAALAVGVEARREEFDSGVNDAYRNGDYIGLVANVANGKRDAYAAFGELRLPVTKTVELQTALRFENYSDFGNSTTGKLLPRYIDTSEPEDLQDIEAHLKGGIPDRDLDALAAYWQVLPGVRTQLFESAGRPGYSRLLVEPAQVKATIFGHPEFTAFRQQVQSRFEAWRTAQRPGLVALKPGDSPKHLIETLSEALLAAFQGAPLLDAYDVYQRLMDYWDGTMNDDAWAIALDGWQAMADGKPNFDLIPEQLVIARYFAKEQAQVDALEAERDAVTLELEELIEEHGADDGPLDEAKNDKGKVTAKGVKDRLREVRGDKEADDERALLEALQVLFDKEAAAGKKLKAAQKVLAGKVSSKYGQLTAEEVKVLVVDDKWLAALHARVEDELARVSQGLTGRVRQLAERYAAPLATVAGDVESLTVRVGAHLTAMGFA